MSMSFASHTNACRSPHHPNLYAFIIHMHALNVLHVHALLMISIMWHKDLA